MTMDRLLRLTSGTILIIFFFYGLMGSNVHWFWKALILFMGIGQVQSAFTNWCPVVPIYRFFGIKECRC